MSGLKNGLILFPDYFNLQSNKNLLGYFLHDYYYLLIVLIIIIWFYLKHTEYNKLVLILTFFLGYILIINVSYPNGADQFYLENQYLILSIIVGIPLLMMFFQILSIKELSSLSYLPLQ